MTKNFVAADSHEVYLYDLELSNNTVNQGLAIDEQAGQIYASQVINLGGAHESYIVTRTSLGGKKLDSMTFQNGGHGTSIGIERDSTGKVYIWANMLQVNASDVLVTQWLCRVPYLPNTTINISDSRVQKIKEFPNPNRYQSTFTDAKNNLVALRITDKTTATPFTVLEVYTFAHAKSGNFSSPVYTYSFTSSMNSQVLQGLALDGSDFYVSFGQEAAQFYLYRINLSTGAIIEQINRPIGLSPNGDYVEGFGEPEGLFLYTDPNSGYKTLLTVIIGDLAGRRRQRLIALSSNIGVQRFQGFSNERMQAVPLTRPDNKAKRIDPTVINSLAQIKEPGSYYMVTAEGNAMSDHPLKNVGGWYLYVSGGDAGSGMNYGVHQILARNSATYGTTYMRTISHAGVASPWFLLNMTAV